MIGLKFSDVYKKNKINFADSIIVFIFGVTKQENIMKIQANLKCWGVELEISTNNATIKEDLNSHESNVIVTEMIHSSKDIFKYHTEEGDLGFCKNVIEELQLDVFEIEELISYLQTKIAD